jgi:hypothetical protein
MRWIKKLIKRRQMSRAFGQYMSRDALRELESMEGDPKQRPPLPLEEVYYIILQVRDDSLEDTQRCLVQALEILFNQGGVVESIMSSVVFVTFKPDSMPARPIDAFFEALGSNVRAVYGQGGYPRGIFGSARIFRHGTILPNFNSKLEILGQLEFGFSKEL